MAIIALTSAIVGDPEHLRTLLATRLAVVLCAHLDACALAVAMAVAKEQVHSQFVQVMAALASESVPADNPHQ